MSALIDVRTVSKRFAPRLSLGERIAVRLGQPDAGLLSMGEMLDSLRGCISAAGDVPVLGHLFKSQSRVSNRKELLVFITPRIVSDALTLR